MAEQSEHGDGDEAVVWGSAYPPSINAGIPKLGELPAGWSRLRMKDMLEVIERPVKLVDDQTYQLVTAKRSRGGIVSRGTLRGDEIRVKQQFEVRAGDFILSNRQIAHGGCGIVPPELDGAVVSGEYTVLHPKPMLDLRFLHYLSHSAYFQQICFHSGVGVHVEKLVFRLHDWLNWQIDVPPFFEQRRIAEVLADFDNAIEATDALVAAKQRQKRRLINQIFAPSIDLNLPIPRGWSRVRCDELARVVGGSTPDTTKSVYWGGDIPWCTPTDLTNLPSRYISKTARNLTQAGVSACSTSILPAKSIVLCSRASVGESAINTVPMCTNQGFQSLVPKQQSDLYYLFYLMRGCQRRLARFSAGSTFLEFPGRELAQMPIVVPPSAEREKVGRMFAALDDEIDLMSAGILALGDQRRGLMQKLLSGDSKHHRLTMEDAAV
jgi:type I restriction enzyme S subunit